MAARREKRGRKADEKKQRKLNATILRRMVRLVYIWRYTTYRLTGIFPTFIDKKPGQIQQECRAQPIP